MTITIMMMMMMMIEKNMDMGAVIVGALGSVTKKLGQLME